MLYEFGNTLRQIQPSQINPDRIVAGMVDLDTLKAYNGSLFRFGPECIEQCERPESRFRSTIEVSTEYMFSIMSVRNIGNVYTDQDRLGLFIKRNLLLLVSLVDEDGSQERIFENAVRRVNPATTSLERIICVVFERLFSQDNGYLEEYESAVGRMEAQVERGITGNRFNSEILAMRRKLLIIRSYYEQMIDIAETMVVNDAELFREDKLHHFVNLQNKLSRLSCNTQLLRDNLNQVREAYQAALDYNANQIMKVVTVVTTVFLPLSLIAGWYGMNFRYMPELAWRYGYVGVMLLSVAVILVSLWLFKKKKLL